MYLVDTSVWIDYLNDRDGKHVESLDRLLGQPGLAGITGVVFQEILQGARTDAAYRKLHTYFRDQRFYHPKDPVNSYSEAARIYFRCRKRGITIRFTIDCLIAQIAIEHNLVLFHNDQDFVHIASVVDGLQQTSE